MQEGAFTARLPSSRPPPAAREAHGDAVAAQECRTLEQACNDVLDKADTEFTEIRARRAPTRTVTTRVVRAHCGGAACTQLAACTCARQSWHR